MNSSLKDSDTPAGLSSARGTLNSHPRVPVVNAALLGRETLGPEVLPESGPGPVNNGSWRVSRVGTKKRKTGEDEKGEKSDVGGINLNAVVAARHDGDVAVIE